MRPNFQQPAMAPAGGGLRWWSSPSLYIFGGLALMLGMIPVGLILFACFYVRGFSDDDQSSNGDKTEKSVQDFQPEMEPRVVVIMAGETIPTHLAKPVAAVRRGDEVV